jgi:hypothetical protein
MFWLFFYQKIDPFLVFFQHLSFIEEEVLHGKNYTELDFISIPIVGSDNKENVSTPNPQLILTDVLSLNPNLLFSIGGGEVWGISLLLFPFSSIGEEKNT